MKQLTAIIIGAGGRGCAYAKEMKNLPEQFKIVAVAEPDPTRRKEFAENNNLPESACYNDWQSILEQPRLADIAVICTQDNAHYEPALKSIALGYQLLLEKPVAQTVKECVDIANAAKEAGVAVLVCHVLRYTPFFKRIKSIIEKGTIGDIMSIMHLEGVGNVHQSHSYVRGNWHSEAEATPMLLAKSCHDIDILQWLMDKPCKKVSSFGELTHFAPAYAPKGAPVRCADGGCPVADTCPYNCIKLYYDDKENSWFRRASTVGIAKSIPPSDEDVMTALKTTDYGLCVYQANNDVVDHQVVNMLFDGGATVNFSMNAFNEGGRSIRIFGTKGEITGNMADPTIDVYTFADLKHHTVSVEETEESILGGHGGGDGGIIRDFYEYLNGTYTGSSIAEIQTSVSNHLLTFAAEEARHTDTVVSVDDYFARNNFENK